MKRALLVLDLIPDMLDESGPLAGSGIPSQAAERRVIENTNRAVAASRAAGDLIVWVTVAFEPGYRDWPASSPLFGGAREGGAFLARTAGAEIHPDLDRERDDPVIVKPRVSPFFGTRLESLLRAADVDELVVAGATTDHVVLAAARDGHDRDFAVVVLTDATSSSTEELHDAALALMSSFTRQLSVEEWEQALS